MSTLIEKIAVLCPSRFRPEGLRRAVDSWKRNSVASDIIFGFQKDDPNFGTNMEIAKSAGSVRRAGIFEDIGMAAKVNELCKMMPGYAGYMVLNDDQVIWTPEWDRILLDTIDQWEMEHGHRLVIPHWRDGIHDAKLAQGFTTAELLQITQTFYPVGYMRHLFVDNYFMFLGKSCDLLHYVSEVYIEHLHPAVGKAEFDASYALTQKPEHYTRDGDAFEWWVLKESDRLIAKIEAAKARKVAA